MNLFTFDIETVPDTDGGRRVLGLPEALSDEAVAEAMFQLRRQEVGHDFLRLHLQRVVAISVVLRTADNIKVWSLGDEKAQEKELIQRFFTGIERFSPTLISWNGSGFDLPVLHYRSMLHKVSAPRYWDQGEDDSSFKWNNYISRYHQRHTDVMDLAAMYQARAYVPLDQMATLLGYPGKMGMSGGKVWSAFQNGELSAVRNYCETDVLNTYLVYLRFQHHRGQLTDEALNQEEDLLRDYLLKHEDNVQKMHMKEFAEAWAT